MSVLTWVILSYLLGAVLYVIGPYIMARIEDPNLKFDIRYVISKALGALIPAAFALLNPVIMAQLTALVTQYNSVLLVVLAALFLGGGATLGRYVQKYVPNLRNISEK